MQVLVEEAIELGQGKEIRGGDTEIGEVQGETITYNDYFNDSSDEGSYVESEGKSCFHLFSIQFPAGERLITVSFDATESEDYVDSDFVTDDEEEDEDDEEAEDEIKDIEKSEKKKSKKGAYVDPAKRGSRAKAVEDSDSDSDELGKPSSRGGAGRSGRRGGSDAAGRAERSFRSTTTMRSEASKSAATEAQSRKQEQGGRGRGSATEERRFTQEELLAEAAQTAIENDKDLQVSSSPACFSPAYPSDPDPVRFYLKFQIS
jgi:hypothetical protein